ncbi:MAG: DUF3990 domain-containing protein [Lachnospiraceae bacterium]
MGKLILYHGSSNIIESPKFGVGKAYNDYGMGFYCTENLELAKDYLRKGLKVDDLRKGLKVDDLFL